MKVQLFSTPSGYPAYYLRLKDGVYDRVNAYPAPCTASGTPIDQRYARAIDKDRYLPVITSAYDGYIFFGLPEDAEVYTVAEVAAIDHPNREESITHD